jgi:hypothetical protein
MTDPLGQAEQLLVRLEVARERLEATEDPDTALELLEEIAQLARDAHAEIERAKDQIDQ